MNNPLNLLVAEGRPEHLQDFLRLFAREEFPITVILHTAGDLKEALRCLAQSDLVLTAAFLPRTAGGPEEPCGRDLAQECLKAGKPVVWATSGSGSGRKARPLNRWGGGRGLEMFDRPYAGEGELPRKPWEEALYGLLYLALALEEGAVLLREGAFLGRAHSREGLIWYPLGVGLNCAARGLTSYDRYRHGTAVHFNPLIARMEEMGFGSRFRAVRERIDCLARGREIVLGGETVYALPGPAGFGSLPRVSIAPGHLAWTEEVPGVSHAVRAYSLESREVVTVLERDHRDSPALRCEWEDDAVLAVHAAKRDWQWETLFYRMEP